MMLLNKLGDRNILPVARRKEREEQESSLMECGEGAWPAALRAQQRAGLRLAGGCPSPWRAPGKVPGLVAEILHPDIFLTKPQRSELTGRRIKSGCPAFLVLHGNTLGSFVLWLLP